MIRRILTLVFYLLFDRLAKSLSAAIYVAFTIGFYMVAFRTRTPEPDYFILVIGFFGALITFLISLSLAARANEAKSYTILVRLESRVEYLAAVLAAAVASGLIFQLALALFAVVRNTPEITLGRALEIPPLWLAVNIIAATLALHASDFVANGWSRVWLFGTLAVLLLAQDGSQTLMTWLSDQARRASAWAYSRGSQPNGELFQQAADWINQSGQNVFERLFGFIFWPFKAIIDAVISGYFTRSQALAPALLLIYATALFLLAADLLATKDVFLTED